MPWFKNTYDEITLNDKDRNEYLYTVLFRIKSGVINKNIAVVTNYDLTMKVM